MANYITTTEADTYFNTRLNTENWDDETDANKLSALTMATKIIDRFNYVGSLADSSQDNQFPRGDDTDAPQDIKDACAEIALALIDGIEPELEFENLTMTAQGIGAAKVSYDRESAPEHIVAGVPSASAWRLLRPYIRDVNTINLYRRS